MLNGHWRTLGRANRTWRLTLSLLLKLPTAGSSVQLISRRVLPPLLRPSSSGSAGMVRLARVYQERRPSSPILHHLLPSLCLVLYRSSFHWSDLVVNVSVYVRPLFDHISHLPSCLLPLLSYRSHRYACHRYYLYLSCRCIYHHLCSNEEEGNGI